MKIHTDWSSSKQAYQTVFQGVLSQWKVFLKSGNLAMEFYIELFTDHKNTEGSTDITSLL